MLGDGALCVGCAGGAAAERTSCTANSRRLSANVSAPRQRRPSALSLLCSLPALLPVLTSSLPRPLADPLHLASPSSLADRQWRTGGEGPAEEGEAERGATGALDERGGEGHAPAVEPQAIHREHLVAGPHLPARRPSSHCGAAGRRTVRAGRGAARGGRRAHFGGERGGTPWREGLNHEAPRARLRQLHPDPPHLSALFP